MKVILVLLLVLFLQGCVSVKLPDDQPFEGNVVVNVSVFKSNAGKDNALTQKTDTKLPITPMGQQTDH